MVPALTHCLFNLLGYHANACKNHGSTCINRTTANEWLADWLSCGRNYGPRRSPSHQCHFILTVTAMRGCMHGWMSCTTPCTHIVGGGPYARTSHHGGCLQRQLPLSAFPRERRTILWCGELFAVLKSFYLQVFRSFSACEVMLFAVYANWLLTRIVSYNTAAAGNTGRRLIILCGYSRFGYPFLLNMVSLMISYFP